MATKPENVNPFAKYVEQSGEVAQENPFAKFVAPALDVEKLKAETKKYEAEVPFTQRITDPLKQGIANLSGLFPGLEVSSIQKEINAIREGKRGPRDPLTGEQLPFQPEEQENAIKVLQEQQKQAQAKVMSAQAEAGKFQTRPAVAALSNVDSSREAFQAFQVDPLGVMSSVSLQSLPQIVPSLILGAVTRNPTVGALAMGSTSFAGELSSGVSEYFQEQGINIKDPVEVNKALNDPAMFAKAYEYALTRGSIIGVADTAAAGLASKLLVPKNLIKNQFAKEAVNIGVAQPVAQIISGAGGEAAAQLATEGEVTKPGQVLLEAAGEGPSSVLETAAFGGKRALDRLKATPTEPAPEPAVEPAPAAPAAAAPSAIITEEDLDEGLTPVSPTAPTPAPAAPAAVTPTAPPIPTSPTAEIAQRIEELDAELKAIDAAYATATPDQFGELNARQGEIKSEIARLFQAGTTGAPVEITPVATETQKPKKYTPPEKKPNDAAIEAEGFALVEELKKLGDNASGDGLKINLERRGGFTNADQLKYYKDKLVEAQQKVGKAPEMPKETFNLENYIRSENKTEVKRFNEFLPKAPVEVQDLVAKSNNYLQAITDKVNSKGFKVSDISGSVDFGEMRDLRNLLSGIAGTTFLYVKNAEHIAKQNRFANPDKLAKAVETLEQDFANADRILGSAPAAPTVEKPKELNSPNDVAKKNLNVFLSQDKDDLIKFIAENDNISLDYAKKVYDAEKEYREAQVKYYFPELINSPEFKAAQNKYDAFQNRLRSVRQKNKEKKAAAPVEVKKTQAEINRERQAKKKAAAKKPAEVAPKIEDIVSPEVAASIKDLEFQNRLIKANKEKSITENQFSKLFKLYQDGKTPQADEQLTKMLAKNEKKAKAKEEPEETHIEGKKSEPVTTKTIEKAVTKAGETVDYAKIKKAAENQIDQAIKRTKFATQKAYNDAKIPETDRFVTIKLEGDGSFKVMNNKERLEEFKKKLANAIKPKQAGVPRREWESAAVGFKAESAFKNFLNEQEPDTAVAIAELTGLDITKVVLNPAQRKVLDRYIAERKETGGEEPMMETIKSKPGANVARIAKLLGPQLYGSMSNITDVSVKEMLQNSFDAIKTMIEQKKTDFGKIDIVVDKDQRTVAMTDDGSGMSPDTLANTFLTIAGTKKDTEFGSGGFGIAKMLFLFGNEDVEVMTMKDGKISSMYAKGGQLMASLEDPSLAPEITIFTKDEMPDWNNMFPKGHGTFVRVTVPKQFKDQSTGEMKEIDFPDSPYSFDVLQRSPLFSNIEVTFNGNSLYGMGSNFDANDYTTFVDANFDWGTARIYVSNDQKDAYGENMQILSNGLWQFSDKLKLDPQDMWGKNIPHRFYLDIVSKVKPDEEGYPFQLNRQGFTKEAEADLKLIKNYLVLHYRQKDYNNTVQNFGTVQYLNRSGKDIIKSPQESLVPENAEVETKEGIKEGSKVEVKDGKLIVNGKEVPLLTPEDLKKASIDVDALRVPQDKIDPNKVMIHDNLEVSNDTVKNQKKENEILLEENYENRNKVRELLVNAETEEEIEVLKTKQLELRKEQDVLIARQEELGKLSQEATFIPITTLARDKFGDRFDKFMFDIGDVFMALRDATASNMPTDRRGNDYKDLAKEAIGVSFDKEYRGVSIVLPFKGLFINPAFPEYIDTPEEAALGMFGTMIHELAHHKVRNHGAEFPAEMQRILIKLESSSSFDINQLKKDFILTVKENKDIIDFLNKEGSYESNRPIGQRFKDSQQQARGEGAAEDVPGGRQEQRREPGLPSESGQGTAAAGEKQKPKSVSPEDKTKSIEDVNELLDKHNRPDAPRKPSLSVRDTFMGGYGNTKETVKNVLESPLIATNNMIGKADRALTYFRNKNIFFGYGLEEADRQRYSGQVRTAHQQAIASVAVVNALHSGNIATQVMTQGKLEFDPKIQMFVAAKSDKSMANVVREKAKIIDKLGFETGNRVIQSYFEAKRSRSIVNEYVKREATYEAAIESGQNEEEARRDLANIEKAIEKVNMDDEAIDDFIALEKQYPELRNMMDNWTAVNQNMIDMMEFSGIISKQRAKSLRSIKDYVPWYRIMDDQEDIHSAPKGTRGLTNVAADKKFGQGKTDRDIDDIVDNMIHNVLTITRNTARNYAANRVVMEYGERYTEGKKAGKLRVFPKEGSDAEGVRFNIIANGRRIVVRIRDPLVAESVIGLENIDIPMNGALAFMANTLRRSITTFPAFQVAQLFMDAPTASLVTGLKRPDKVWAGVFTSFLKNLRKDDPIVAKLRTAGIGGYQSSARTPEKEIQLDIGLIQGSWFSRAMKGLDRFGDASDYAQRRSVYIQTIKETKSEQFPDGDELLALFQSNNVIDFKKRGSGQIAQIVTRQVAFMNAYAQAIDVLAKGLAGTGLKGIKRRQALARMAATGMMLASATLVYCFLVGDDEEYNKLDDQTKMRTIFIPGLGIRLPMHSGAAFFFKAIPELLYNAITKEGTKDEYDRKRLTRALSKAAADALLGPNPTPTGVKPVIEIALNRNFFTGGQVTPRGMEDLAAFRQYNQNTSELGKIISALTGTEKTRLLNPIEADHLIRGLTGTIGASVMWGTNLLSGDRPTAQAKDNPFYGQFIMPDVPRGREDLYYDLKEKTDEAYKTYTDLQRKGRKEEAAEWFKENKKLIQVYGYTSGIEVDLKRLNGEIRRLSDLPGEKMSPDAKRKRMTELQEIKGRMLKDVISMRKRAGFDE